MAAPRETSSVPPATAASPLFARWGWLWLVGGALALFVVWRFEPAGQSFYPRCWLYTTTGLQCPGCGATRALHALLHGDLPRALRLNALVVGAVPLVGWLGLRWLWGWRTGRWWGNPLVHPFALAALAGLAVGFGITRNF